jgi:hypothetical protein
LVTDGISWYVCTLECQQNWTWSATRQVGKLGPELGEAQFLLTDHGKNATLSVHTVLGWENARACAAIMTEREITDKRNRIRIKVKRTSGFFTLGVCTGRSPPQLDYRRSFAAFVAWDNEMVSYDITGQLINPYHGSSTTTRGVRACVCVWRVSLTSSGACFRLCPLECFPGFESGDEIAAHVEGDTLHYFRNGEEVGKTDIGALPQPWHFYCAVNCQGSSARILRASERSGQSRAASVDLSATVT